jgi:hypothetical protein
MEKATRISQFSAGLPRVVPGVKASLRQVNGSMIDPIFDRERVAGVRWTARVKRPLRPRKPPRLVKAGAAFVIPAGKGHGARNPGREPLRFVGVYVVEKGKPLITPAK